MGATSGPAGLLDRAAPVPAPPLQDGGARAQDLPVDATAPPVPSGSAPPRRDELLPADEHDDDRTVIAADALVAPRTDTAPTPNEAAHGGNVAPVSPASERVDTPPTETTVDTEAETDQHDEPETDEHDEPATRSAPPTDGRGAAGTVRSRWRLLVAASLAAGLTWAVVSSAGDPLAPGLDGDAVRALLTTTDERWRALAAADDATVAEGAGCWLAPAEDVVDLPGTAVVCGPALFAAADAADELWAVARLATYEDGSTDVGPFTALTALGDLHLEHPDGARPPRPSRLTAVTSGALRAADGRRLLDGATVLAAAETELALLADAEGAALARTASCRLAVRAEDAGPRAGDTVWCGPVETSAGTDRWATAAIALVDGPDLTTTIPVVGPLELGAGRVEPDDVELWTSRQVEAATVPAVDPSPTGTRP